MERERTRERWIPDVCSCHVVTVDFISEFLEYLILAAISTFV